MNQHPRYEHTLEDLCLHVFVYVDDWLKVNEARLGLPVQSSQVASYSELFTVALVGEMMAQPYQSHQVSLETSQGFPASAPLL